MQRREFFKLGLAGLAASGLVTSRTGFASTSSFSDYKALVCITLNGGNDGFNMLLPSDEANFKAYSEMRGNLAVQTALVTSDEPEPPSLALTDVEGFYYHEAINQEGLIKTGFDGGNIQVNGVETAIGSHLAGVLNVGNLIEPIPRDRTSDYDYKRPPQLFAHGDQLKQVFTCADDSRSGWGGRLMSEVAQTQNPSSPLFSGVGLGGSSYWLANTDNLGVPLAAYSGDGQNQETRFYHEGRKWKKRPASLLALRQNVENNLAQQTSDALLLRELQQLSQSTNSYIEKAGYIFSEERQTQISEQTIENLKATKLGAQLLQTLRVIEAREDLGMQRQLFSVGLGGFDTHSGQNSRQPELLRQISSAMAWFRNGLVEIGMFDQVVAFTASEFGRSMTNNGNGTDHGWGNHHLVMGGAVKSRLYGSFPDYAPQSPDYWAKGRVIPSLSIEQYMESILSWFGLDEAQKNRVMPRRANFDLSQVDFFS